MGSTEPAVLTRGLRKAYGETVALDGLDLTVPTGMVYGLLGPNGAGKSTAVRVLATLLRPDAGEARVAGFDVVARPREVRERIGLVGQSAAVDEALTGRDNLVMFARLLHLDARTARHRAQELLDRLGLEAPAGDRPVAEYSGGMRRRLDLAIGLIRSPAVLFLDEPTAGLDPRGRAGMWDAVREVVAAGTTVLLTTQYLEEADRLAGRICLIDHGRAIAEGTPAELKAVIGGDRIEVVPREAAELAAVAGIVARVAGAEASVDREGRRVTAPVADGVAALTELAGALRAGGVRPEDLAVRRPTLDEVFLRLTGDPGGPAPAMVPATGADAATGGAGKEVTA